jgi:hypothetical protein
MHTGLHALYDRRDLGFSHHSNQNRFGRSSLLDKPAAHRLPFRELGLAIGLYGLQRVNILAMGDHDLGPIIDELLHSNPLADRIESSTRSFETLLTGNRRSA